MKENERLVVAGGLSVLLLGWLGFLVHSSPRFAGSGIGAANRSGKRVRRDSARARFQRPCRRDSMLPLPPREVAQGKRL